MTRSADVKQLEAETKSPLRVQTLGQFQVWLDDVQVAPAAWGRETALHLFQFLVTMRRSKAMLHKEQIIDHLWPEHEAEGGDQNFRVALHAVNKVLEPDRKPRAEPYFIQRQGLTYGLNLAAAWVDADAFETFIATGNQALPKDPQAAITAYQEALALYGGDYLPERQYEDWSSPERERLQILALNTMTSLAEMLLEPNPLESIRWTQQVLAIDPIWENAYRTQMRAYAALGNRPLALRSYQQCTQALEQELGIEPLPETRALLEEIKGRGL